MYWGRRRHAVVVDAAGVVDAVVAAGAGMQELTQLLLSSTPGFLIASEPQADGPSGSACSVGLAWADYGCDCGCPWGCRAYRDADDIHHGRACVQEAYRPSYLHPWY